MLCFMCVLPWKVINVIIYIDFSILFSNEHFIILARMAQIKFILVPLQKGQCIVTEGLWSTNNCV